MSQNAYSLSAGPSPEEWETRRPHLEQLYLKDRKKLKEVMAIMNRDGFKAR